MRKVNPTEPESLIRWSQRISTDRNKSARNIPLLVRGAKSLSEAAIILRNAVAIRRRPRRSSKDPGVLLVWPKRYQDVTNRIEREAEWLERQAIESARRETGGSK